MRSTSELLLHLISVEDFKRVRSDLVEVYRDIYYHEEVSPQISQWRSGILDEATNATTQSPQDPVLTPFEYLETVFDWIKIALMCLGLLAAFFGIGVRQYLLEVLDVGIYGSLLAIPVPVIPVCLLYIYIRVLRTDRELIQSLSEKLVFKGGDVHLTESPEDLFAYFCWNRNLWATPQLPIVGCLVLLRYVHSGTYYRSIEELRENIDLFQEESGYRETVSELFARNV